VRSVSLLLKGLRCIVKPRRVVFAGSFVLTFCAPEMCAQADFNVDANLVVLHVTVANRQGLVPELPKATFLVYEDGIPESVTMFRHEDAAVAVGLVVDSSGSMRRKLPDVVAAADAFARSSNPEDEMFVVNFNERVSLGLPLGEAFVSSPGELEAAMLHIQARGETALYDAVATALDHIRKSPLEKKVLIVLSDGGDNASTRRFPEVLSMIQQSDVIVYTVGLFDEYDKDRNPGVLRQLAKVSGGEAFLPKEVPEVTNVLQTVSRDIRHQYMIGYVPTNETLDGTYRHVFIKLTGPHADRWIVRTRTGYFASLPNSAASESQKAKER
jgi:Ca-activated chloride channel family protein